MDAQFHALKRFNHLIGELDAVYHDMSLRLGPVSYTHLDVYKRQPQ